MNTCENTTGTHAPSKKRMRQKRRAIMPPASWSSCVYVRLAPSDTGMFRYLLEAEDNLGYMSVVDRWGAALQVVFSPHQEQALRERLESMRDIVDFTVLDMKDTRL